MDEINFDKIFSAEIVVPIVYNGNGLRFKFRETTSELDLESQRRQTTQKYNHATQKVEPSIEALTLDVWLFDQLCTGVDVVTTDEGQEIAHPVPDYKTRLNPDLKRTAIFHFRMRMAKAPAGN